MKTFMQWAEANKLDLPLISDSEPAKKPVTEKAARTGLSANYPSSYKAGQYPHKYFNPIKATTDLDIELGAKVGGSKK